MMAETSRRVASVGELAAGTGRSPGYLGRTVSKAGPRRSSGSLTPAIAVALLFLALLAPLACASSPAKQSPPMATPTRAPATEAPAALVDPNITPARSEDAAVSATADAARLTVEEYPVVARSVDQPNHFEYNKRIDRSVLERRKAWRAIGTEARLESARSVFARVGYRLDARERAGKPPLYDLYRGSDVALADIANIWSVASTGDGRDIAIVVEGERGRQSLVRRESVESWDDMRHAFTRPVFVGGDLTTLEWIDGADPEQYVVVKGGQRVQTITVADRGVDTPIKALGSWDGHWVVEVRGQVYVDGRSLNEQIGADEVFGWHLVDGRPFYFFAKGGQVGMSFDGRVLPQSYDEVIGCD
jgi:hypothetical protein